MSQGYVAFDIETAEVLPARIHDLQAHRPLGISCAVALTTGDDAPELWHGRTIDRTPDKSLAETAVVLTSTSEAGSGHLKMPSLNPQFLKKSKLSDRPSVAAASLSAPETV